MKLSKAAKIWIDYHKTHSKKKILPRSYCEPVQHDWIILKAPALKFIEKPGPS